MGLAIKAVLTLGPSLRVAQVLWFIFLCRASGGAAFWTRLGGEVEFRRGGHG